MQMVHFFLYRHYTLQSELQNEVEAKKWSAASFLKISRLQKVVISGIKVHQQHIFIFHQSIRSCNTICVPIEHYLSFCVYG